MWNPPNLLANPDSNLLTSKPCDLNHVLNKLKQFSRKFIRLNFGNYINSSGNKISNWFQLLTSSSWIGTCVSPKVFLAVKWTIKKLKFSDSDSLKVYTFPVFTSRLGVFEMWVISRRYQPKQISYHVWFAEKFLGGKHKNRSERYGKVVKATYIKGWLFIEKYSPKKPRRFLIKRKC